MTLPSVAIVGRPNVGKSTLMNRILGRREAIVEERPGVTRDRKEVVAEWNGRRFLLIDTGGWMASGNTLDDKVSEQSERAIASADVVMLVVDGSVGLTDEDARVGELVRRTKRPTIVVVNKIDDTNRELAVWDFLGLGLGEPVPVSALHGRRAGDLLDLLMDQLPPPEPDELVEVEADPNEPRVFRVAILGRPNVGKSTLFNRMIGDERSVVHDQAGTTRDAVDTIVDTDFGPVCFVDTAGMRRKSRIDEHTEYYSLVRALRAVDSADVALLVVDATQGITHQDQRLAERIDAAGCPVVILLNKWELLSTEQKADVSLQVTRKLHFVGEAPILRISALSGKGVNKLLPALASSIEAYQRRIPTARVNEVMKLAQSEQPGPHGARVLYATQGAADPPTFTLFANKALPASYLRYLERRLREAFDMGATPVKLRVRHRAD